MLPCHRLAILISLFQVIRALGLTLDLRLPSVYVDILSWLSALADLRMGSFVPLECIFEDVDAFHVTLFSHTVTPLVMLLLLAALHFAFSRAGFVRGAGMCIRIGFWLVFLVYTSVTATIFETFVCYSVADGTRMLRADLTIDCKSDAHLRATVYAIVMVFVYPIGVFCLYATILFKNRGKLRRGWHHHQLRQVLIDTCQEWG